jgi:UDP-N-acetylglucosamine diphosphorylase/glucosamine-1-phosphate N-acetyltransferase
MPQPFVLFEDLSHADLLPFTYTRPLFALRSGIFTFGERWSHVLGAPLLRHPARRLRACWGDALPGGLLTWVNGKLCPDEELLRLLQACAPGSFYVSEEGELLCAVFEAGRLPAEGEGLLDPALLAEMGLREERIAWAGMALRTMPDLFRLNAALIRYDFPLAAAEVPSQPLRDPYTRVYGADNLYLAPGASVRAAILNAEDGPIYLGPHAEIGEGAIVKGTHAFCEHAFVNMGAKLRGDSTIGPWSKVGGELGNSVLMGYSNKAHDGYLGNSAIGYWCNLGADTNTSNLKNTYETIRLWHYPSRHFRETGLQFCGLMMGDHSKCAINTMFNTGTVVGVSANVFGEGFPRNFIPSFAWGGSSGFSTFRLEKAFQVAEAVMSRRGQRLSEAERALLADVYARSAEFRTWEKRPAAEES